MKKVHFKAKALGGGNMDKYDMTFIFAVNIKGRLSTGFSVPFW